MKQTRVAATVGAIVLATILTVTGCSAPVTVPNEPGTTEPGTTDPGTTDPGQSAPDTPAQPGGTGEFMLDPAFPWPADVPRPPGTIVGEFAGKNPLGEGGVRNVEFTASHDDVTAYVASLIASGWEAGFGMSDEPMVDDGGNNVSWLLTTDSFMGTIATTNGKDAQPFWEFSVLG